MREYIQILETDLLKMLFFNNIRIKIIKFLLTFHTHALNKDLKQFPILIFSNSNNIINEYIS